jgi:hypothetical protein
MTCCTRGSARTGLAAFLLLLVGAPLRAQDLEPRAYTASPIGLHFLVAGLGRSSGGVVVDPSLPVDDVDARVGSVFVGAGTTFALFGRSALLLAAFPWARAKATGRIGELAASATRSGLADPRFKLSVNLVGGRALTPKEFATVRRTTIAGVSVSVVPPLGQYDRTKLVNIGSNRWSFKPEFGLSRAIRRWTIEGYAGVWLFTTNDTFYTGSSIRTQDPITALQGHASYTIRPRLWFALDGTWYSGGATTVDGVDKGDLQRNSRLGATLSVPINARQSAKVAFSTGATTRIGGDFNTIAVSWQLSWLTP